MSTATASALRRTSISLSMTRPHATTDSRLLQNLIKAEKSYVTHLASTVTSSQSAASALKAWGTSEARDVAQTSSRLADLLSAVSEAQTNHLEAIRGYREALKDVADREASIRIIVRDRDILVSRLIKASKKNGDVDHAQRELTACEEVLEAEERALIGVKRRTFKEALSMRMKLMGDAGSRMIDCAKEAILLLDGFDQHAGLEGRLSSQTDYDDEYRGDFQASAEYPYDYQHTDDTYPSYSPERPQSHEYQYGRVQPDDSYSRPGAVVEIPSRDQNNLNALENASVTPSQSASQAAYGNRLGQQVTGGAYQQPAFVDGAPHESAEDRADSNASSEADVTPGGPQQAYVNHFKGQEPLSLNGSLDPAPTPPLKAYQHAHNETAQRLSRKVPPPQPVSSSTQHPLQLESCVNDDQRQRPLVPQPQMFSATAPRFNYDDSQLAPIPQAPRLYHRNEDPASSSEEDVRPTNTHQGWTSRFSRGRQDDDSSDDGRNVQDARLLRRKADKHSSFLGRFGKLFKTDVREVPEQPKSHRRSESLGESARWSAGGAGRTSAWHTRTDRNLRDSRKESMKTLGTQHRASLLRPLAFQSSDDSSDDEERRTDLIRITNTGLSQRARSDVGGSFRRTPSEIARIAKGPRSIRQRRALDEREQADLERKARKAVMGSGVGSTQLLTRSSTVRSTATSAATLTKKKKKKSRAPSIAGSEIGTSATRQAPSARPGADTAGAKPVSWVVPGDLSSGNRGLATLVLPSDLAKADQGRSCPSIMPPTGLSPAARLSRSNSASTTIDGKPASIRTKLTSTKKKRRHSAIEGPSTGLVNMSSKDSGKHTANTWLHQPQGVRGLAAQAVASAGLVAHNPATGQQIAENQIRETSAMQPQPSAENLYPGSSAMRHSSSQQSTPLKSALKQRGAQRGASPAPASAPPLDLTASLAPLSFAPLAASSVLQEVEKPLDHPIEPSVPRLPNVDFTADVTDLAPSSPSQLQLSVEHDMDFDGAGKLDVSRSTSNTNVEEPADRSGGLQKLPLPRLDMPESEPFNVSFRREGSAGPSAGSASREVDLHPLNGPDRDEALLTPGEQTAYHHLLRTTSEEERAERMGIAEGARSTLQDPVGVTRIIANRVRVGGAAPYSKAGDSSSIISHDSADVRDGGASSSSTLPQTALLARLAQPSRTYSSEGKTLHSSRPAAGSPGPGLAAPLLNNSFTPSGFGNASATGATNIPKSDVSNLTVGSSGGAEVSRRKSVRLAPDTKLPPETPPAVATGFEGSFERKVSDGFGGFKVETVRAPSLSIVSGYGGSADNDESGRPPSQLSTRITATPQAPPRLPFKEKEQSRLSESFIERERTGWTTRIDRRLAAGGDDSSDEEGSGGIAAMSAGEGADAYASARRAMGVASKHWNDALSPGSNKKKKNRDRASSAAAPTKTKGKQTKNSGYNPDIPLPKGMEVVGRQTASR